MILILSLYLKSNKIEHLKKEVEIEKRKSVEREVAVRVEDFESKWVEIAKEYNQTEKEESDESKIFIDDTGHGFTLNF